MKKIKGSRLLKWLHWSTHQFYLNYHNNPDALRRDLEEANKDLDERFPNILKISSREQVLQLQREGKW